MPKAPPDPAELRRRIQRAVADAVAAVERGDHEEADRCMVVADLYGRALEKLSLIHHSLTDAPPSPKVDDVTAADRRRGESVARTAAEGNPLLEAITKSKWKVAWKYARMRLDVSPASFTNYHSGKTPCPRRVAKLVLKDFGFPMDERTWPAGIVD